MQLDFSIILDWLPAFGSALLAQVERTFTASGTLKCLMENKNALRFYQRHGWTIEAQGASPEGGYWLMRSPRP